MSHGVCATCRKPLLNEFRSVCETCFPSNYWEDILRHKLIAACREVDIAADRVHELEKALKYIAECETLEMVRDTVRGMGLIQ